MQQGSFKLIIRQVDCLDLNYLAIYGVDGMESDAAAVCVVIFYSNGATVQHQNAIAEPIGKQSGIECTNAQQDFNQKNFKTFWIQEYMQLIAQNLNIPAW